MPPSASRQRLVSSIIAAPPVASAAKRHFAAAMSSATPWYSSRSRSHCSRGSGSPFCDRIASTSRSFMALPVTNLIDRHSSPPKARTARRRDVGGPWRAVAAATRSSGNARRSQLPLR